MKSTRVAVLLGGATLLAAWFAAAAGTGGGNQTESARPAPTPTAQVDPAIAEVLEQAEGLRARLDSAPRPQEPSRNPFTFKVEARRPVSEPVVEQAPPLPTLSALAPRPALTLVGIGSTTTGESTTRTAIISGLGDLFLVKVGEEVAGRYRVNAVGEDAVELVELSGGTPFTLVLR